MFEGFSQETVDFLWGVRFNNERGWFLAHKDEFKASVDEPLRQLAHEVADVIMEEYPKLVWKSTSVMFPEKHLLFS